MLGKHFCLILDPVSVQDCKIFPSLIKNVLLIQLVRDIINAVYYKR